ncbi:MAG: hypothetical protein AAFP92_15865 [Bacteroidota bacterium]
MNTRIFPLLVLLGLASLWSCSYRLEKKLFKEEYETALEKLQEDQAAQASYKQAEAHLEPFLTYLDKIAYAQRIVNRRIDSLEKVDNWPRSLEEYEADDRFKVASKKQIVSSSKGPRTETVIRYLQEHQLISPQEKASLHPPSRQFPDLLKTEVIFGRSNGLKVDFRTLDDSLYYIHTSGLIFYGQKQDLPDIVPYVSAHKRVPAYPVYITETRPAGKSFYLKMGPSAKEVPVYMGKGYLHERKTVLNEDYLEEIVDFWGTSEPSLYKSFVFLKAGKPLNTTWLLGVPDKSLNQEPQLPFATFYEGMDTFKRSKLLIDKLYAIGEVKKSIKLLESLVQNPVFNPMVKAYFQRELKHAKQLSTDLKNKKNEGPYYAALAALELYKGRYKADPVLVYQHYKKSLAADPENPETWELLIEFFDMERVEGANIFPNPFPETYRNSINTLELNIDSLDTWIQSYYFHFPDSLRTYEFMVSTYQRNFERSRSWECLEPGCSKAEKMAGEAIKKFPQEIRAYNLRADFLVWEKIMGLASKDRSLHSYESLEWERLGTPDSVLPLLFEDNGASFSRNETTQLTEEEKQATQKEIQRLRQQRLSIQQQIRHFAQIAKQDAEFMIEHSPQLWNGYWLRALSRYWLGERADAQRDYCKAWQLYRDNPTLELGRFDPDFVRPYYQFESCRLDKS